MFALFWVWFLAVCKPVFSLLAMTSILTYVNLLSCAQLVICFCGVSLFLTVFINNVWISLCYFGALPAGILLANQLCSRTKFLDISSFILTIRHMHKFYQTLSNGGNFTTELSSVPTSPNKTATSVDADQTPAKELSICLDFIIRDFFESWYCDISAESTCQADAHEYLSSVFSSLVDKLRKIDTTELVRELSVIYTSHLQDIHKANIYMCEEKKQTQCVSSGSQELLTAFCQRNTLHPALESDEKELNYLRAFVEVLGHSMLPVDLYRCSSARYILLDILTKNVMLPVVDKLSDPHWVHETLIKILCDNDNYDIDEQVRCTEQQTDTCNRSRLNETDNAQKMESDVPIINVRVNIPQQPDSHRNVHMSDSYENLWTVTTDANAGIQIDLCEAVHVLDTNSTRESGAGAETIEHDNPIITSLRRENNLDLSTASQTSELGDQQMFVADDLGRYLHVVSDHSDDRDPQQDNSEEMTTKKLSQHHLPSGFTEVERHRTLTGLCASSRNRSQSFSSQGCVSSGSDASLSVSFRKPRFLLENDDFSSQSDIGSRQSLDLDTERAPCRLAPLGCSFRQKWISSENLLQVEGRDGRDQVLTLTDRRRSRSVTDLPVLTDRRSRSVTDLPVTTDRSSHSVTDLPVTTAEAQCAASDGDPKVDSEDWTPAVSEDTPTVVSGGQDPGLLFTSVIISDTVTAREPGSTGQYTLYVIEYTAWHKGADDHWTEAQFIVHRRHKEFVALQQRLGVYPAYKSELRGVKGPLRWMSLPFANMDRSSIESRRRFLQSYLQALITKPRISGSDVMKEFLAYERDASIAFVKRAPEIPRIDKAITRTMSGMFSKISKIVPGTREVAPPSGRHAPQWQQDRRGVINRPIEQEDWTDSLDVAFDVATTTLDGEETLDRILAHCIHDNGALANDGQSCDSNGTAMIGRPRRSEGDGCDASKLQETDDTPLTTLVIDLLTHLLTGRESWVKHSAAIHFFHIVFGHPLNKFLQTELASLTTPARCGHYIQVLRESIWPGGQLAGPETVVSETQKEMTRLHARQTVYDYLPGVVPLVMGEETYSHAVDAFIYSLDSPVLNRHLLYCLLDQMLELIVPEASSVQVQQELRVTADY